MTDYENMITTLAADTTPYKNSVFYLHDIEIFVDQEANQMWIPNMVLTNRDPANYGVQTWQGFAYTAAGQLIGRNPTVRQNSPSYDTPDANIYLDSFTDTNTPLYTTITRIIIQVYGRDKSNNRVFMAYVDIPVTTVTNTYLEGYVAPPPPPPPTTAPPPPPPACFVAGSQILTPGGYKAVETIHIGDLVLTADKRAVTVKGVYNFSTVGTEKTAPFLIPAHTFGEFPKTDMRLSPLHAFYVGKGLWHVPRVAAKIHDAVQQYDLGKAITYYHLECPNYLTDNLVCGGTTVESFAGRQLDSYKGKIYTWNTVKNAYIRCSAVAVAKKSK